MQTERTVVLQTGRFQGARVEVLEDGERSLKVRLPKVGTMVLPKASQLDMEYYQEQPSPSK